MGTQSMPARTENRPSGIAGAASPRDLTWDSGGDDELLYWARQLTSQSQYLSDATRALEHNAAKLGAWRSGRG